MGAKQRVFNLEEANALVPELEMLLREFEEKQHSFERLHDGLFFEEILGEEPPPDKKYQELEGVLTLLEEQVERIGSLGCVLRDPRRGRVDFLARTGKGLIYYCWQRGEKQIQYCHSLRDGFLGRHPI